MKIFTWINIRLVLLLGLVVFLFSFASHRNSTRKIIKTQIVFEDQTPLFLSEQMVNKLLIEKNNNVKTLNKVALDLKSVEDCLKSNEYIQNAEVFLTIDGVLKIQVKQRVPLARVFDNESSFYIDNKGDKMSLSDTYAARVPLVSGEVNKVKTEQLSKVMEKIEADDFLKKNIIGVQVLPNGNIIMKNRNYDFIIEFGSTFNIERKFYNYKAFFQKAVTDSTLTKYKRINLKFTQQVVCVK